MTSGIEAVGDVASGAVLAHAVEPAHGEGEAASQGACLNCGTQLVGAYCHACGQKGHLHRTISGFLHDLLHGVFHFEGKLWDTLPLLFFKPGELTRRYIAGERAKFVSPMAMFLFCVFLMFAVVGSIAGEAYIPQLSEADKARPLGEIRASLAKNEASATRLKTQIKTEDKAGRDTAALEARLEQLERDTEKLKLAERFVTGRPGPGIVTGGLTLDTGWAALDRGFATVSENPTLFLYQLKTSAYKYSWLLIPISTPLVWLLFFWKRQYKFYDHLVFVTLSITFMLLFVTLLTVLGWLGVGENLIVAAVLLVPPLHLYRQTRGAYASSRLGAILRTGVLVMFGFLSLLIYLLILIALGVMH